MENLKQKKIINNLRITKVNKFILIEWEQKKGRKIKTVFVL